MTYAVVIRCHSAPPGLVALPKEAGGLPVPGAHEPTPGHTICYILHTIYYVLCTIYYILYTIYYTMMNREIGPYWLKRSLEFHCDFCSKIR